MGFVTSLPKSHGYSVIFVMVDRLSKYYHLGALHEHFTVAKVATLFLQMVINLHGFPRTTIFNRDPIFTSHFLKELFRLSGTQLNMSSAYHSQSDDQTEVLNQTI